MTIACYNYPMNTSFSKSRGFTLIELMVVIAIIALLTGIVVTAANPSKQKARDAKRIADIGNIQVALALYFDRCKQFPTTLVTTASNGCPSVTPAINLGSYLSVVPTQPNGGAAYGYAQAGSPPNDYVLYVTLEGYNEALKDDMDGTVLGVACGTANDTTERLYCLGPK